MKSGIDCDRWQAGGGRQGETREEGVRHAGADEGDAGRGVSSTGCMRMNSHLEGPVRSRRCTLPMMLAVYVHNHTHLTGRPAPSRVPVPPDVPSGWHSQCADHPVVWRAQTDSLRKFYSSLRAQRPDSQMARKWCASSLPLPCDLLLPPGAYCSPEAVCAPQGRPGASCSCALYLRVYLTASSHLM